MPLTTDAHTLELSEKVIGSLHKVFGEHPGFRAAHAKGALVTGTFTPTPAAAGLSKAPHFHNASTPVTARFSSSTGIPQLPDSAPDGEPRGLALRFELGPRKHTDIIAHSTNAFPVRTGEEFLEFFQAVAAAQAGGPPIMDFIAARPAVARFATTPKPMPTSLATEAYFALVAVKFISASGAERYGRYDIVPVAGVSHVTDEERQSRSVNYLYDEIRERISKAPVQLQVWVQLANDGDVTDDVTVAWPEDRERVLLGTVSLDGIVTDNEQQAKKIIFDPTPRVEGIEPSGDPLFQIRDTVYLMDGKRRRAAPATD
jgi:catalase